MSVVINPFIVSGKIPEPYFCDRVEEWKSRARLTPEGKAALTPENLFVLTPVKS